MNIKNQNLQDQLKGLAKDKEAYNKLEELFDDLNEKYASTRKQLELLEYAIRNDYDSILITELTLEKPGPKIVYVNNGFTKMTGYSKEEAIGKTPRMLQGPKTDHAILERLKRRLIEGQAFFGHTINYRKDGTEFINQWDIHPLINDDGQVTHWVSYQRDVTEKKETAKAIFSTDFDDILKRREEFTIKFVRDTLSENKYRVKFLNEAFEEITGFKKEKILDTGLGDVVHTDDMDKINAGLDKAFEGETHAETCRYKTSAGEYVDMLQSFKPVFDESGHKVKAVRSVVKIELKES